MAEEQLEYDIGDGEEEATVSMNEDGSEATLEAAEDVQTEQVEEAKAEAPQEEQKDELDQYSDNVQKRINKLTARLREHQRREEAALEYAKTMQAKAQDLESRFTQTDAQRRNEAKSRMDTQSVALKQIIRKAREEGDYDTELEAQERLTAILWEQQQFKNAEQVQPEPQQAQQPEPQQAQQPQPQPQRTYDEKAENWAVNNDWFGKDNVMTHAAYGIHRELVGKEGFDPKSDEYYHELDKRIREVFPNKFATSENRATRPVQGVAPATRSSGVTNTARRSVRLSPSQVAIAKKLGVPLEEYAKYVKE
jgi:hypothetical protein